MGPLTSAWRTGTQQTSTIASIDANQPLAAAVNDGGNNLGVGGAGNANLGLAVDFIGNIADGSTECYYDFKFIMADRSETVVEDVNICDLGSYTIYD